MLLIYRVKKETTTENQSQLTQPVAYRKRMRHVGMFPSLSLLEDWALSSVQSLSRVRLFATPQTAALQAPLSITNSQSLLKLMSIESVMPFNHLTLCHPLLLLPSVFPSIRVFFNWESQFLGKLIRSLGSLRRRKGPKFLKKEIGVWNSQERGKDKLFFLSLSTFLSHIKCFFL